MLYKNMPDKYYRKAVFIRFVMDYLAAVHYLLKLRPANAFAVIRARMAFLRLRSAYQLSREENLDWTICEIPLGICKISILYEYYLRGKKRYLDILNHCKFNGSKY